MKQIFKNLAPHWRMVLVIVVLLLVQAYCELSLPQYTSDIIDVGIQDGGMEHIVPEKITQERYERILLFMDDQEKALWEETYSVEDGICERKELSEPELDELDQELLLPILIDSQADTEIDALQSGQEDTGTDALQSGQEDTGTDALQSGQEDTGTDAVQSGQTDTQALQEMVEQARESFRQMQDTIGGSTLQSKGIAWASDREEEAGVDLDAKQMHYLWLSGIKMLLLAFLMGTVAILVSLCASRVGAGVGRDLRHRVFHQVVGFSNKEMDHFSTASLITRSTNDVQQIQLVTVMILRMVVYAPILGIGGVIKVIQTGAGMGWIIVLAVLLIVGFVLLLMAVAMPKFKMMQKLIDAVNLVSREILTGLSVIRAFGREKKEEERFDAANRDLTKTQLFTNRVMSFMMPGMMTIMYGVDVLIVWVAAHKIDDGLLQVGEMTAFITYAMQIVMAFLMLTMMSIMLPRAGVAAERIEEVVRTETSIQDAEHPKTLEKGKGILEFHHVSFRYPGAGEDVLSDISFVAEPGKTTAIIGSTGCGKSTLVNLIPRLYDVTEGKITYDGTDIRELSMSDLREQIGFVPQKAVLFSGTIDSNLRFGVPDASEETLKEAAGIAQAMEFIDAKPERFHSRIAQGGSNVSGGQKQRLSIARAIAKNPGLFVFDDSFSALDMKTDAALRNALSEKVQDSAVIIVAQRISTIIGADQILVLDDGRIVGAGTHQELLQSCEVYEQIARSQMSEKELGLQGKEAQ